MNGTAVQKTTPQKTETSNREHRILPPSIASRDQAEAELAEAQKAINALKRLLANPPQ